MPALRKRVHLREADRLLVLGGQRVKGEPRQVETDGGRLCLPGLPRSRYSGGRRRNHGKKKDELMNGRRRGATDGDGMNARRRGGFHY